MVEFDAARQCPCGSGRDYGSCCRPLHRGEAQARGPEQLMRSRYCAYVLWDDEYLRQSWHPSTRPEQLDMTPQMQWLGLEIVAAPSPKGDEGFVEFIAHFRIGDRIEQMRERSRFVYEQGRWFYIDGVLHASAKPDKIGRNELCPCGSGRKFKRCCGAAG